MPPKKDSHDAEHRKLIDEINKTIDQMKAAKNNNPQLKDTIVELNHVKNALNLLNLPIRSDKSMMKNMRQNPFQAIKSAAKNKFGERSGYIQAITKSKSHKKEYGKAKADAKDCLKEAKEQMDKIESRPSNNSLGR